jgi:hypothetical protein
MKENISENTNGNGTFHVDSYCYDCFFADIELSFNLLGEPCCSGFLFVFNIDGLPTYPGTYDKFLIIVGLLVNALTIWYAWTWV